MAVKYLLDTDIVSYALKGHEPTTRNLRNVFPGDIGISSITLAELRIGARLKSSRRIDAMIDTFAESVMVASFDYNAATEFGRLGALLREAGTPIGTLDTLIAGHAVSLGCILVTNNTKHFSRVPGLVIENWSMNQ
ncbi:MAG: type II toxin-antitoxin system VapC family toxin [Pyrinomonadaceae bacterium]|nr:type II toxin-antitoxin system VapC family toxin [Pyrinomonadaceae bacterium]